MISRVVSFILMTTKSINETTGGAEQAPPSLSISDVDKPIAGDGFWAGVSEAPAVIIKNASLHKTFQKHISTWKSLWPQEYEDFKKDVEGLRSASVDRKKFTRGRMFLHSAEIPRKLFNLIAYELGSDWTCHYQLLNPFLDCFPEGCVNLNSRMTRDPSPATCESI